MKFFVRKTYLGGQILYRSMDPPIKKNGVIIFFKATMKGRLLGRKNRRHSDIFIELIWDAAECIVENWALYYRQSQEFFQKNQKSKNRPSNDDR